VVKWPACLVRVFVTGALTIALATLFATAPASAAPPVVAGDPARHSDVTIADGSTFMHSFGGGWIDIACVAFVNHGPRTATGVGLDLASVDAEGNVVGVDSMYPTGKFLVGQRSAVGNVGFASITGNGNCYLWYAIQKNFRSTFQHREGRGTPVDVAAIVVAVREIQYDDGTKWRTDQPPYHQGDRLAVPHPPAFTAAVAAGAPIVTGRAVPGSPVEISDAALLRPQIRAQPVCVTFTNRDPRTAKRVDIALALVNRSGTVDDVKTLYNKGTYSTGITISESGSCIELEGHFEGDGFFYGRRAGTPIGRIIAVPLLVEFADGTSWEAPSPPQSGDTITGP
jgi:hypothetical protein